MFPEALLHYVWKFRLFDHVDLLTEEAEIIDITDPGLHNKNSGPDFSEAKIRINDKLWAGHVEIHLKSSDWLRHGHQDDAAYENVILHVVYENDTDIRRRDGTLIPVLVLKNRISPEIIRKSLQLYNSPEKIPCASHFSKVPEIIRAIWIERLTVERLENKTEQLMERLVRNNYNWESSFYELLARNFGMPNNADAFEHLARITPVQLLAKHKNSLFQLEALLFGQAGMLEPEFKDDYAKKLKTEYLFLRHKYNLTPMMSAAWKFGRMRPAAFPSIRIALLTRLIEGASHLFSKLLETESLQNFKHYFNLNVEGYWLNHYRFDDETKERRQKRLGDAAFDNIVINTLVPVLFLYGVRMQDSSFQDRALSWLEEIKAEDNNIMKLWKDLGMNIENAHQSQGLLELKKQYCDKKRCLDCSIGNRIMK